MTSNGSNAQQCHQNTDSFYSAILNMLSLCSCFLHEALGITSKSKARVGKGLISHTPLLFQESQAVFLATTVSHSFLGRLRKQLFSRECTHCLMGQSQVLLSKVEVALIPTAMNEHLSFYIVPGFFYCKQQN